MCNVTTFISLGISHLSQVRIPVSIQIATPRCEPRMSPVFSGCRKFSISISRDFVSPTRYAIDSRSAYRNKCLLVFELFKGYREKQILLKFAVSKNVILQMLHCVSADLLVRRKYTCKFPKNSLFLLKISNFNYILRLKKIFFLRHNFGYFNG